MARCLTRFLLLFFFKTFLCDFSCVLIMSFSQPLLLQHFHFTTCISVPSFNLSISIIPPSSCSNAAAFFLSLSPPYPSISAWVFKIYSMSYVFFQNKIISSFVLCILDTPPQKKHYDMLIWYDMISWYLKNDLNWKWLFLLIVDQQACVQSPTHSHILSQPGVTDEWHRLITAVIFQMVQIELQLPLQCLLHRCMLLSVAEHPDSLSIKW